MSILHRMAAAIALTAFLFCSALAADSAMLPPPHGVPVLTVTGAITKTNIAGSAQFDTDMLAALPRHSITTATPWYDKPRTFEGPLLRDILSAVGANGSTLKIAALDDYAIVAPAADAAKYDVVVADRIDGKPIPVRERGPLFIIYPFDQVPELRSEQYYQRAVWQTKSIEVQP